jgi:hypothetical protein
MTISAPRAISATRGGVQRPAEESGVSCSSCSDSLISMSPNYATRRKRSCTWRQALGKIICE